MIPARRWYSRTSAGRAAPVGRRPGRLALVREYQRRAGITGQTGMEV